MTDPYMKLGRSHADRAGRHDSLISLKGNCDIQDYLLHARKRGTRGILRCAVVCVCEKGSQKNWGN